MTDQTTKTRAKVPGLHYAAAGLVWLVGRLHGCEPIGVGVSAVDDVVTGVWFDCAHNFVRAAERLELTPTIELRAGGSALVARGIVERQGLVELRCEQ